MMSGDALVAERLVYVETRHLPVTPYGHRKDDLTAKLTVVPLSSPP